jgi:hypothetical protein
VASAGGRAVLRELAALSFAHRRDVRVVFAGDAALAAALTRAAEAAAAAEDRRGTNVFAFVSADGSWPPRWHPVEVADPAAGAVAAALRARGYAADDAARMAALCGGRLRLLEAPLARGAASLSADDFLAAVRTTARTGFHTACAFHSPSEALSPADAARLARALDAVERHEARAEAGVRGGAVAAPPKLDMLPAACLASGPAGAGAAAATTVAARVEQVLYARADGSLAFQTRLHRQLWASERERLIARR